MSKVIGIDLGTTNSVVAVMEGGEPAVIVAPIVPVSARSSVSSSIQASVRFTVAAPIVTGQLPERPAISDKEPLPG